MEKTEYSRIKVIFPLIFALLAYFMSSLLRLSAVVAMPILQEQLQLSSSIVGIVSSSFYITYALMQVVGGAMCLRFGTLTVLFFDFIISGAGTFLFAVASNPLHILLGRIMLGLGVGPVFVVVISILQENFTGKEYSKWMGIAFVASNTGAVFSSAPLQIVINRFGIRTLFTFFAEILLVCAVFIFVFSRIAGKQKVIKDTGIVRQIVDVSGIIINNRVICGCFLIWIIFNSLLGVYQSLWCVKWTSCAFTVMPSLNAYSGTLIGVGVIIGCLVGDSLRNRNFPRLRYIRILSVSEIFSFLLLIVVKNISDSLFMLIIELISDCIYGYVLGALCIQIGSYVRENSDTTHNAMIMGIMNCVNNLVSTGLQSLSGVLIDAFAASSIINVAFSKTFCIYEVLNVVFIFAGLVLISSGNQKK